MPPLEKGRYWRGQTFHLRSSSRSSGTRSPGFPRQRPSSASSVWGSGIQTELCACTRAEDGLPALRAGTRNAHLLRGQKAGRWPSGAGPAPSFPLSRTKNKAVGGIRAEPPALKLKAAWGAPFQDSPAPSAEAFPSWANRVTSRDRRAGGCHGDM